MKNNKSYLFTNLFLLWCITISSNSYCNKNDNKIIAGFYVEDIYNIDYVNSSFEIVTWVWINSKNDFYDIQKYVDIPNSTDIKFNYTNQFKLKNGLYHSEVKITATILNKFDVYNYPFDIQYLNFEFEFIKFKSNKINFIFDKKNSRFSPEYVEKWKQLSSKTILTTNQYESNFGNSDLIHNTKFNSLKTEIKLVRNRWSLFVKLFLTLFISFFLASFSIFLPNRLSEEKIGLMLASLFASIGNKYITDDALPVLDTLNLSDKLHILTICFIAIFAVYAIYEQRKKLKDNRKLDYGIFISTTIIYFLLVAIFCQV